MFLHNLHSKKHPQDNKDVKTLTVLPCYSTTSKSWRTYKRIHLHYFSNVDRNGQSASLNVQKMPEYAPTYTLPTNAPKKERIGLLSWLRPADATTPSLNNSPWGFVRLRWIRSSSGSNPCVGRVIPTRHQNPHKPLSRIPCCSYAFG